MSVPLHRLSGVRTRDLAQFLLLSQRTSGTEGPQIYDIHVYTGTDASPPMTVAIRQRSPGRFVAIGAALLVISFLAWKLLPLDDWFKWMLETITDMGAKGMLFFVVLYVVTAVIGFPRIPFNVGAGIMFSYPVGLALVLISDIAIFILTFQISRRFARDWVLQRLQSVPNVEKVLRAVEEEGLKLVVLLRMNPFLPGIVKGYGFGTTNLPFRTYIVGSIIGAIPLAAAYVYLGWLGGEAMMDSGSHPSEWQVAFLVGGAVVSFGIIGLVSWYGRRALQKQSGKGGKK